LGSSWSWEKKNKKENVFFVKNFYWCWQKINNRNKLKKNEHDLIELFFLFKLEKHSQNPKSKNAKIENLKMSNPKMSNLKISNQKYKIQKP